MANGLRDLVAKLRLDTTQFTRGIRGVASTLKAVGAAMTAASVGVAVAIKGQLDAADEMSKSAAKFGIPIETLSKLKYAADLSGVSMGTLGTGVRKLSQNMADAAAGNKAAAALFDGIGVSATNADGSLRNAETVMQDVADVLAKMPDGAAKTALAMDLFGKSGAEMLPMLNGGSSALQDMMREAESLGLVFDAKTGKAAENFNDNISRLKGAVQGLVVQLAAALAPTLEAISAKAVEMTKWFRDLSPEMQALAAKFVVVAMAAGPLVIALGYVVSSFGAVAGAFKAAALLAVANPFVAVAVGVAAAAAAIYLNWEPIKAFFADLWAGIATTATDAWNGIKQQSSDAFQALINGWTGLREYFGAVLVNVKMAFVDGWEAIKAEVGTWPARFVQFGYDIVEGLKRGILEKWDAMVGSITGKGEELMGKFRGLFGIQSPSKVFRGYGRNITEGLAIGISDQQPMVDGAMAGVADSISGRGVSLADRLADFKSAAENAFVGFVTGAQSAREALAQLASSMAQTLAKKAFSGLWGALFPGFADGGVFSGGRVQAFAKGGVVAGATAFAMSSGLGVMGEAGPEAIMPLSRGADGKLGVRAGGASSVMISLAPGLEASILQKAQGQTIQIVQASTSATQQAFGSTAQSYQARGTT